MIKDDQKVKLEVMFQSYDRYQYGELVKATIERDTFLEALKVMVDNMCLYLDSQTIVDDNLSCEDIVQSIIEANGDGCDYIFSFKDLLSGEEFINDNVDVWQKETW